MVEQYLAFAESQAKAQRPMYMKDWIKKLNDILTINEREILERAGKVTKNLADELAAKEYEKYDAKRKLADKIQSLEDLQKEIKFIESKEKKKKK